MRYPGIDSLFYDNDTSLLFLYTAGNNFVCPTIDPGLFSNPWAVLATALGLVALGILFYWIEKTRKA
jgi:hypothetical protein